MKGNTLKKTLCGVARNRGNGILTLSPCESEVKLMN